jgi:hypothetical protein
MTLEEFFTASAEEEEQRARWIKVSAWFAGEGHDYFCSNVEIENRLPVRVWRAVFGALQEDNWSEMQNRVVAVFQSNTLKGSKIADTPRPKGRAWDLIRLIELLYGTGELTTEEDEAQFVNDIRAGRVPFALRRSKLGAYVMWSTFSPAGGDPFAGIIEAETVRSRLGLMSPIDLEDKRLVVLVYYVPLNVSIHYPTIADAYAGTPWNPYFQCSNPGDPWGYTSGRHPEVVHDVIDGTRLVTDHDPGEPVRILD